VDGGPRTRITPWPGNDLYPLWSPDGRWIAFATPAALTAHAQTELAPARVELVDPTTGEVRSLPSLDWLIGSLTWSSDGTHLAGLVDPGTGLAMVIVSADGREAGRIPLIGTDAEPWAGCPLSWQRFGG
jgi:Tol biopolymer transport system component